MVGHTETLCVIPLMDSRCRKLSCIHSDFTSLQNSPNTTVFYASVMWHLQWLIISFPQGPAKVAMLFPSFSQHLWFKLCTLDPFEVLAAGTHSSGPKGSGRAKKLAPAGNVQLHLACGSSDQCRQDAHLHIYVSQRGSEKKWRREERERKGGRNSLRRNPASAKATHNLQN